LRQEIDVSEVRQICSEHQIEIQELKSVTGSFGKQIFFINQVFLLRISKSSMDQEQEKFRRIAALNFVPKILHTGILQREAGPLYYTLLTLLPGDDFVNVFPQTTLAQQTQLGEEIAGFLEDLHAITGAQYDIGMYVPVLAGFSGTWREGHQAFWQLLEQSSANIFLQPDSRQVFARAFQFLRANSAALEDQSGPVLLHNDFHPKNILLDQGKFSGVIDWECSQFGEADFELCHLVHWCLYPPEPGIDFRPFLRALFAASPRCTWVPQLNRRLTIYQIEHEIQQIVWNASDAESWRVPRLVCWMEEGVEDLL
jgi:aminoglycoside phosphotransferase (APT) family kinase protein